MVNVILDLDETLIRTVNVLPVIDPELVKKVDFTFKLGGLHYYIIKRPGLDMFLDFLFKYFSVGIWTASNKDYAKNICKNILSVKNLKCIKFIYSRNFCFVDGTVNPPIVTKPLVKIFELYPDFNSSNTIIIDNNKHVTKYDTHNAITIPDFFGCAEDQHLYHIRNTVIKYYKSIPTTVPIWGLVFQTNKVLSKL